MMKNGNHRKILVKIFLGLFLLFPNKILHAEKKSTVILVDKKTNTLHLAYYDPAQYKIFKSFHTTVGKIVGDKEVEGDLKTPEGIYTFKARLTPPSLKPKFGVMAFYMNYPNPYDKIAGRTGFDIMLHATDEPERLKKDFDSEGCIVVDNKEIQEIQPYIHLGLTPIMVFSELMDPYLKPESNSKLIDFFKSWSTAWESKNMDTYIDSYHTDFTADGKSKAQWKDYKSSLNSRYAKIEVKPENVMYFRHPKYTMITFVQNYRSVLKDGSIGHRSRGTKILYVAEEDQKPKIISESFTQLVW